MKKIHLFTFIKNEEKIIESFILYHQQIADKITIIDNGSTDNTLKIINKYLNQNINLIIDNSDLDNKGSICTNNMLQSEYDVLVPLDADEFLLYDNGSIIKDDPRFIKKYLKTMPINGHRYKINKVYSKIENTNSYCINKSYSSNKIIFPRNGFVEVDCGFHVGKVLLDAENSKVNNIDISYLHLHYISKDKWINSSNQKLKARLGNKFNLNGIIELAASRNKSNHVAKEMVYYFATNKWHNLKHDVSFETPHLTSLFKSHIIPP